MKKIGIMSMQRIINYGSFLQAYGLYKTIKDLGYDVQFVDYHYGDSLENPEKKSIIYKIKKGMNIIAYLKRRNLYNNFRYQINKNLKILGVYKDKNYVSDIDSLVIGSDEVFNCMQGYPVGYSLELFGKGFDDINVLSYAASFGYTTVEKLESHNKADEIANLLSKFKAISVRDENSASIVNKLCGINPEINLDPVLISDYTELLNKKKLMDNYIIVYAYSGRLTNEEEQYIKNFAKRNNKKIISLGFYQKIADYNIAASPLDVLGYFKHADYIITDTFHGSVFSIKTNAKFCTIVRQSNRNKLAHLLTVLKQSNRIVENLKDIDKLYEQDMDYSETNKIIEFETEKTKNYLKKNLD